MSTIDWLDSKALVAPHFTVQEALWLPSWGRRAIVADGLDDHVKAQLVKFMRGELNTAREWLGKPFITHCCYRPKVYNAQVHGAPDSAHLCRGDWAAWDGHVQGMSCDEARAALAPHLEQLGLRMERLPGAGWVHLDNRPPFPGQDRYFTP